MTELFDRMLHYLDYLCDHSEKDLVTSDRPNAWCLGDEHTMCNMIAYYEKLGMYECGIFGTEILPARIPALRS